MAALHSLWDCLLHLSFFPGFGFLPRPLQYAFSFTRRTRSAGAGRLLSASGRMFLRIAVPEQEAVRDSDRPPIPLLVSKAVTVRQAAERAGVIIHAHDA